MSEEDYAAWAFPTQRGDVCDLSRARVLNTKV